MTVTMRSNSITLEQVLAKLRGVKYAKLSPDSYSTNDILKARAVLKRLLEDPSINEVASIREVAIQNNEI